MAKKSKKRPNRNNNAGQNNKAKQFQLLQKQRQQQQESPPATAGAKAGRSKNANLKSSRTLAPSGPSSGSAVASDHAPTGTGPPSHPRDPARHLPTRGLLNLGNTCFFNSVLQNIFKARLLHESLFGDDSGRRQGEYLGPLTKALRKVLLEMTGEGPEGGRRGAYSPKALLSAVQRAHPSFRGYQQHDAHELFMHLIGTLEDEEDSCIQRRRQEEKEMEKEKEKEREAEGGVSTVGSGNGDVLVSSATDGSAGYVSGDEENDGAKRAARGLKEALNHDEPELPEMNQAGVRGNRQNHTSSDSEREGLIDDGAAVTPSTAVSTSLLSDVGGVEGGCAGNGGANNQTASRKNSDEGAGSTPSTGAENMDTCTSTCSIEEGIVLVGVDNLPKERRKRSSAADGEGKSKKPQLCGGAGVSNADAETSTDDGETTDEGDHDDDDDEVSGTPVDSPPRTADSLEQSAGADVVAVGNRKEKEKEQGEHDVELAKAPVAPAVAQRAAVTEVFGGMICSVVTCGSCGGRSFCTEPTVCLSLEIPLKISKTAQAFIAKRKAAAAAAAAAKAVSSGAGTRPTDNDAAEDKPSLSKLSGGEVDESGTEPALGQDKIDESEGFQLSAKQKRKVARQERERQRLIEAEAQADGDPSGDTASVTGKEDAGERNNTGGLPMAGGKPARQTRQDAEDEVRQCLECVLSVCIAVAGSAAGAGGDGLDTSGTGLDEVQEKVSQAPLPGFQLSAEERKKRSMEAEKEASSIWSGETASHRQPNEGGEAADGGGDGVDVIASAAGVVPRQQSLENPRVKEKVQEAEAAEVVERTCSRGDGGDDGGDCEETCSAPTAPLTTDSAMPDAKCFTSCDGECRNSGDHTLRLKNQAAGTCERADYNGGSRGGVPLPLESAFAGVVISGQVGQVEPGAAAAGNDDAQEPQVQELGFRSNRVEEDDLPGDARAFSSSGSLAGCTTGETQGSADLCEDGGSAFGSECSEVNRNGKKSEETTAPADAMSRYPESSGLSGAEEEREPRGNSPAVGSASRCLQGSEGAAEGEVSTVARGRELKSANGDADANDNENDGGPQVDGCNAGDDRCGVEEEGPASSASVSSTTTEFPDATATASENPLNRLQEPPARIKQDGRHDPVGIDLYGCLDHFMAEENLVAADGNGYECDSCSSRPHPPRAPKGASAAGSDDDGDGGVKVKDGVSRRQQNARKRLLMLGKPPGVLVCHLKRLQAKKKIMKLVEFPIDLDMAPYFWLDPDAPLPPKQTCYRLVGLIQHRGSRLGGHYVAYVRDSDGWKHASDSSIRTATLPELKACEAYMLFYERCDTIDPVTVKEDGGGVGDVGDVAVDAQDVHATNADHAARGSIVKALDEVEGENDSAAEGACEGQEEGTEISDTCGKGTEEREGEGATSVAKESDEREAATAAAAAATAGEEVLRSTTATAEEVQGDNNEVAAAAEGGREGGARGDM